MSYFTKQKHWGLKIDDGGRRGHVRLEVGFKNTYLISPYHH